MYQNWLCHLQTLQLLMMLLSTPVSDSGLGSQIRSYHLFPLMGSSSSWVTGTYLQAKFSSVPSVCSLFDETSRVKKLKKTPIYVKPQLTSDSGNCRVSVMVGIRNDPGKPIDSITVQFQLPPLIVSADLTANYGTVDILADKVSVLSTIRSIVTLHSCIIPPSPHSHTSQASS